MGLFDEVSLEFPIHVYKPMHVFQTKDLDCLLDKYIITATGKIYRKIYSLQYENNMDSLFGGYFYQLEENCRTEYLTDFHGDITFYDEDDEFTARFSYGNLDRIILNARRRLNDGEEVLHECDTVWKQPLSERDGKRD